MQASGQGPREPAQTDCWAESLNNVVQSPRSARVALTANLPGLEVEVLDNVSK